MNQTSEHVAVQAALDRLVDAQRQFEEERVQAILAHEQAA